MQCPVDFILYQLLEFFTHMIGRYKEIAVSHRLERTLYEREYLCHVFGNCRIRCHKEIVGVDLGIAFMEISGADHGYVLVVLSPINTSFE